MIFPRLKKTAYQQTRLEGGGDCCLSEGEFQEIASLIVSNRIKSLSLETLRKITLANIDDILTIICRRFRAERREITEEMSLKEAVERLRQISSTDHTLYCAVNGREDWEAFRRMVVAKRQLEGDTENVVYLERVTNQMLEISIFLEELFRIDVKRRIGALKKDYSFLKSISRLEALIPGIRRILEEIERSQLSQNKDDEITEKIRKLIKSCQNKLSAIEKRGPSRVRSFYSFCIDICRLKRFIFEDREYERMYKAIIALEN